jgi:dynein assembly factor 2
MSNQLKQPEDKLTKDEFKRLMQSMDKPEFKQLFDEYLEEISNPNNITETNQFLKQAEETKDLPPNVRLGQPSRGFCIRSEKYSIKRPGIRQKVFINICQLDDIRPPFEDEAKRGYWSLPHLINKGRNDQDKKKEICTTYDIIFHSKAITLGKEHASFKKFLFDTSVNAINNNLLKSEGEKISNDYVVKKFEYKGNEVALVNIHSLYQGEFDNRKEPSDIFKTNIQKEVESIKEKKEEDESENIFDKPDVDVNESEKEIRESESKLELKETVAPKYKLKYSTDFELHKYFYLPSNVDEKNYQKLIIEIEVPKMDNLNLAQLELDTKKLFFKYKDIYLLDIALPCEIDKDKSDAKFDRNKNVLTISARIINKESERPNVKDDENIEIVKDGEDEVNIEDPSSNEEENRKKEEIFEAKLDSDKIINIENQSEEIKPNTQDIKTEPSKKEILDINQYPNSSDNEPVAALEIANNYKIKT